jgi:L-ascorbate metabolism protein UlaG (beta-lactamase superfamily)
LTVALTQRLFRRFRARSEHRPLAARAPSSPSISIRWLGTAGHVVATESTTVLVDPFLSRPSLRNLARPLESDPDAIFGWMPDRVDAILVGHSHYDHLLDTPVIAKRFGAKVYGSASTLAIARAAGVDADRLELVPPEGHSGKIGDIEVAFIPSLHGRILFGKVPFPGEMKTGRGPRYAWHYRMGGAFGIWMNAAGRTIYHNGSADLVDAELAERTADVLLVGLAGRRATRDYLGRLGGALAPKLVVPTHHDAFFGPLELGERLLPGIDLDGFFGEMRSVSPLAKVVTPLYRDDVVIPLGGDPREALVVEREGLPG